MLISSISELAPTGISLAGAFLLGRAHERRAIRSTDRRESRGRLLAIAEDLLIVADAILVLDNAALAGRIDHRDMPLSLALQERVEYGFADIESIAGTTSARPDLYLTEQVYPQLYDSFVHARQCWTRLASLDVFGFEYAPLPPSSAHDETGTTPKDLSMLRRRVTRMADRADVVHRYVRSRELAVANIAASALRRVSRHPHASLRSHARGRRSTR